MNVRLDRFANEWFSPGRGLVIRALWMAVNGAIFLSWVPWPSAFKCWILRAFGASIGVGVVIKPRVNVKYPWNLSIADHSWIGEAVWIDSLTRVEIGAHCCLSQGVMVETGNHDWSSDAFDLIVKPVVLEEGSWAAVRSTLLPGSRLATHAILGAGSVLSGETKPFAIYIGVPAKLAKERIIIPRGPGSKAAHG